MLEFPEIIQLCLSNQIVILFCDSSVFLKSKAEQMYLSLQNTSPIVPSSPYQSQLLTSILCFSFLT